MTSQHRPSVASYGEDTFGRMDRTGYGGWRAEAAMSVALLVDRLDSTATLELQERCRSEQIQLVSARSFEEGRQLLDQRAFDLAVFEPDLAPEHSWSFAEHLASLRAPPTTVVWTCNVALVDFSLIGVPLRLVLSKDVDERRLVTILKQLALSPLREAVDRFSAAYKFSPTHREILGALVENPQHKSVSKALDRNPETVRVHLHRMYSKTGCDSQADLVALFWHRFACLRWRGARVEPLSPAR